MPVSQCTININPDAVNFQGKTIALIDDDAAIVDSTRILLETKGAHVLTYQSGIDFLRDSPGSDCLVVDYFMPEMNGLAVVSELRRRGDFGPAIMMTALNEPTLEHRAAELGISRQVARRDRATQ
jgi:two-component system, LuxR family, response regulator FixJ